MKILIVAIAIVLASLSMQAQTKAHTTTTKIGDAYATAALRCVIASGSTDLDFDKIEANISTHLDEMEAQATSPVEQKSFDEIKRRFKSDMAFLDFLKVSVRTSLALGGDASEVRASWIKHVADCKPCNDALKANLKLRDGTIPKECK